MKSYKVEIKTGEEIKTIDIGLHNDRLTAVFMCDELFRNRCHAVGDWARLYEDGASCYVHCIEKWGVASIESMKITKPNKLRHGQSK